LTARKAGMKQRGWRAGTGNGPGGPARGDGEVTAEAERGGAAATQLVGAGRMLAGRLEDGAPAAGP
jgi:hypothetical protein